MLQQRRFRWSIAEAGNQRAFRREETDSTPEIKEWNRKFRYSPLRMLLVKAERGVW
jgi:hypothetical protein